MLTRDNLAKKQKVNDLTCVLCGEPESINHLFFDCVVARCMWSALTDYIQVRLDSNL